MIIPQSVVTTADIEAHKQKHGMSGSIWDGNPRLAWYLLPMFTAIREGIIRADTKIEF